MSYRSGQKLLLHEQSDMTSKKGVNMTECYCTRCNADLEKQHGFEPEVRTWICQECGQLLINPVYSGDVTARFNNVVWFCDHCNDCLSEQPGFSDWCENWKCTKCGYENIISIDEIIYY